MLQELKDKLSPQLKNNLIGIKKFTERNVERLKKPLGKRVFCISIQRTGTTSVGDFLKDHGYRVARWGDSNFHNWPYLTSIGNYESIFKSNAFKSYNAFEDSPWYRPELYRILFHRFPKSKFILLTRDSDQWFDSMLKHSDGNVLGNTYSHCKFYQRLGEFYERLDNNPDFNPTKDKIDNLISLEGKRDHYVRVYEEYNRDAIGFFEQHDSSRLFTGRLEDPDKWQKMGGFLGLQVEEEYTIHSNKSE